ncbi:tropomyosin-like [Polyergus mexicanus]|uniref:tropomyosin-like n=1 Tax=Polyergus mexicanus TaxID=615972 RepID=UPI0038B5760E
MAVPYEYLKRRDHDARKSVLGNKGYKYKSIIAPLIYGSGAKKTGAGRVLSTMRVTDDKIDYIYWDDPNELVDRLRLLDASRRAEPERLRPAIESLRNYVRDNALCLSSSIEYDARERKIKRLAQPEEDADGTSKSYVEVITAQLRKDANEARQGVILLFARLAQLDNALGKRIDAAESFVSKIETRNNVLSKRIDTVENSISRTEASTNALGKRIDALDKRINSLSEQFDAVKKTISLNAAESLTRNESDRKIQFNQGKIIQELTKKSRVAENTATNVAVKILELENSTSQLKRNINELSEKVTELMNRKKREL